MEKQLDPAPWQCTLSHLCSVALFGERPNPTITHPPYSPDLALCDFWLFLGLKMGLRGPSFASVEEIQQNVTTGLTAIPQEDFQMCFQQWQDRWRKCVCVEWQFFFTFPFYQKLCLNSRNFLILLCTVAMAVKVMYRYWGRVFGCK
jgi:hypothetical protein